MGSDLGQAAPRLTRHFKDVYPSLESLVNARDAAAALLASEGWSVLEALLDAEVAKIDRELDSGRVLESRAEYAARHGRRGGLQAPRQVLQALIDRADARLAEQRAKHEGDAEPSPEGVV